MAIEAGQTAPNFTLNDQDSNPVTLSELQGKKGAALTSIHEPQRQAARFRLRGYVIQKLN